MMTTDEARTLQHFSPTEVNLHGEVIEWGDYYLPTMHLVDELRAWVGSPCTLIRGNHNRGSSRAYSHDKATAVDLAFLTAPYSRVVMELIRMPCSWGVYTGKNVHMDLRETDRPARWMAFRPQQRPLLQALGLDSLVSTQSDNWLYLTWSHQLGLNALYLLTQIVDDVDGNVWHPGEASA